MIEQAEAQGLLSADSILLEPDKWQHRGGAGVSGEHERLSIHRRHV